jgi:RNA polymerase sigma-70 factor (ECF subfamily)
VLKVTQTLTHGDFDTLTAPLRGELVAHCYRMLGSVQDAEDQVQEAYLRAWRAFGGFEGRSSVRTWMYQIATRTCLTALQQRARRPMPTGLGAPSSDPADEITAQHEVPWLEPIPDAMLAGPGSDPAAVAATRDDVRLAFVAALQHLTPLQRAVVILRDVLAFSAAETAEALDVTVASANSALQRARARLNHLQRRSEATRPDLADRHKDLLGRFMQAFEAYDTAAVVALLADDATWEMPPFPQWYSGAEAIGRLVRIQCPAEAADDLRYLPTAANGQPACAGWMRDDEGVYRAFQLLVLDVAEGPDGPRVQHVSCFFDTALFDTFGLPQVLPPRPGDVKRPGPGWPAKLSKHP